MTRMKKWHLNCEIRASESRAKVVPTQPDIWDRLEKKTFVPFWSALQYKFTSCKRLITKRLKISGDIFKLFMNGDINNRRKYFTVLIYLTNMLLGAISVSWRNSKRTNEYFRLRLYRYNWFQFISISLCLKWYLGMNVNSYNYASPYTYRSLLIAKILFLISVKLERVFRTLSFSKENFFSWNVILIFYTFK